LRRLPYLFSVAPDGYTAPVRLALVPPSRPGFPPTHALLDEIWERYVDALTLPVTAGPFLFGDRFTLADAGVYGQLGMNLADPTAAEGLRARAPRLDGWLRTIGANAHAGTRGPLGLHDDLAPLMRVIGATFVPLMIQNERAYLAARAGGERSFNERAFDRGRALYDGTLLGHPFRAVVKAFQLQVWRELQTAFAALDGAGRTRVTSLLDVGPTAFEPAS
jgi:hypothetical protein